ncbi:MAG: hypothetical protein V2I43_19160 [Parvularcula sp.]|jgi:hypothetical protein|nr:hypothetical protein [Parvularcula sp.]
MPLFFTLLAFLGVAGCWLAWRGKVGDPRLVSGVSWVALIVAVIGWTARFRDSGAAIALVTVMIAALVCLGLVALNQRKSPGRRERERRAGSSNERKRPGWATGLAFLAAGPLSGVAALMIGLSSSRAAKVSGWTEADAIVLAYAAVPIVWAALATYVATPNQAWRKFGVLTASAGLPLIHLIASS